MDASKVICESEGLCRVIEVTMNGKTLVTPAYFPAVSSYGVKYSFQTLVRLLIAYSYPRILISAYDFHLVENRAKKALSEEIRSYFENGCFVFADSGIYESYWKADASWSFELYKTATGQIDFDFYSSFDVLPTTKNVGGFAKETVDNILASRKLSSKSGFMPIMHGIHPNMLVSLTSRFVMEHPSLSRFIAISERDCGDSLVEKAQTIIRIRKILDDGDNSNHHRILHILGCGNLISLLLYSYCGANTFDSLDWVKHAIDPQRLTMNDFSHLELIGCPCPICASTKRNYTEKVLLHNLLLYQNYMLQIQALIRNNEIRQFLGRYVGQNILDKIAFS